VTLLLAALLAVPQAQAARRARTPTVLIDGIVTAVHPSGEDARFRHFLTEVRVLRQRRGKAPRRLFMRVSVDREPRLRGRRDIPLEPGQLFRGLLVPVRRSLFRQATYGIADIPETEDADTDLGVIGGVRYSPAPWDDGLHRSQEFNFERYHLPVSTAAAGDEGASLTVTFAGDLLGAAPLRQTGLFGDALAPRKEKGPPPECGATRAGWKYCLARKDGRWDGGYWGAPSDGYTVIGAVVAGPKGALLLRLFGPGQAVDAKEKDFRDLVAGLEPAPEPPPIEEPAVEPEPEELPPDEVETSTDALPALPDEAPDE